MGSCCSTAREPPRKHREDQHSDIVVNDIVVVKSGDDNDGSESVVVFDISAGEYDVEMDYEGSKSTRAQLFEKALEPFRHRPSEVALVLTNEQKVPKFECQFMQTQIDPEIKKTIGSLRTDRLKGTGLVEIGKYLCEGCDNLSSVDLSGFCDVTKIGCHFLERSVVGPTIDLSPLSKVETVGWMFLSRLACITSLDLTPMGRHLTSTGGHFLSFCPLLEQIDLSPLENLTMAPATGFLRGCTGLKCCRLSESIKKAFGSEEELKAVWRSETDFGFDPPPPAPSSGENSQQQQQPEVEKCKVQFKRNKSTPPTTAPVE